jgi:hypothetical protein
MDQIICERGGRQLSDLAALALRHRGIAIDSISLVGRSGNPPRIEHSLFPLIPCWFHSSFMSSSMCLSKSTTSLGDRVNNPHVLLIKAQSRLARLQSLIVTECVSELLGKRSRAYVGSERAEMQAPAYQPPSAAVFSALPRNLW